MLEDFTPYQESIILKKLGFNEACTGYYSCPISELNPVLNPSGLDNPNCLNSIYPQGIESGAIYASAVTYSQAFNWLSSQHGLTTVDLTLTGLQELLFELKARVAAAEGI